jgi:hypothetical protein
MAMRWMCLIVFLAAPSGAAFADDDPPPQASVQPRQTPDFLFGVPRASVGVRGSWFIPQANSDWYDFVTDQLTIDRHDLSAGGVSGDVGLFAARRLDLVFTVDYGSKTVGSEYRDFVDNNRLPINQTTRLRQTAFTGGVRYVLTGRGREVGSLAWVPARFVPYVGGGGGVIWYQMQQFGDFVDFQDLSVFPDLFESSGWTPTAYVNGGLDVHVYRPLYVTFDGKYQWGSAELSGNWVGFQPLDLGGLRLSTGLSFVF